MSWTSRCNEGGRLFVVLSDALMGLFPPGAVVAELHGPGDVSELLPAEAACLGGAVAKRAQEFAAGRQCARRALVEFGVTEFALRATADRQAVWPHMIAGSITHTDGFCAAVVDSRQRVAGIGIDSEVVGAVGAHLWPTICVSSELAWLESLPQTERAAAVTLLFSAKEAFFKCQYPLYGERLTCHELCFQVEEGSRSDGAWSLRKTKTLSANNCAVRAIVGRYLFHDRFVSTGVALPASSKRV